MNKHNADSPYSGVVEVAGFEPGALQEKQPGLQNSTAIPQGSPDPFDPESLRLGQDVDGLLGAKKEVLLVPVMKPSNEAWIRVHPGESYRVQTGLLELKETREVYLVQKELWPVVAEDPAFSFRLLVLATTRGGGLFLWPLKMPAPDGRDNNWNRSAREVANMAMKCWVRIVSNTSVGIYEAKVSTAGVAEPVWPGKSFRDILELAFRGRLIDSADHPILKGLRGEI